MNELEKVIQAARDEIDSLIGTPEWLDRKKAYYLTLIGYAYALLKQGEITGEVFVHYADFKVMEANILGPEGLSKHMFEVYPKLHEVQCSVGGVA